MATIRREAEIDAPAERVWAALRDWGQLHTMAPGFIENTVVDGGDRIVTFGSGRVLRERIVTVDDADRRLVWTIVDGPYAHHNGAASVHETGEGTCRFVWISDLLPEELAGTTGAAMQFGVDVIKKTMEQRP